MISFSYCLDAAGNLIKLSLNEYTEALIPCSVELTTSVSELEHPLPWTKSIQDAVNEIRFVPLPHVKGTIAQSVHETGKLPESPFVFVPPAHAYAPEQDVMELIALFDDLPVSSDGRSEIVEALAEFGIEPIPLLKRFVPELYSGKPPSMLSNITKEGWISHTKVFRKAQVL
jgi:hypothetical protein